MEKRCAAVLCLKSKAAPTWAKKPRASFDICILVAYKETSILSKYEDVYI